MTISEKVAYLKGLAEGLNLDVEKSKEGKLISVMIGILEEVGLSIEDLEENALALGEEIDVLSDDLADVESVVFDEDEDDEDYFEVECPNCEEPIIIDDEALAAGEHVGVLLGFVRQTDALQKPLGLCLRLGLGLQLQLYRSQSDVFQHRHVGEQVEVLEHHAHLPAVEVDVHLFVGDIHVVEVDMSRGGHLQQVQAPEQGGLAGAGGADDGHHLALLNGEGAVVQGHDRPVVIGLDHVLHTDQITACRHGASSFRLLRLPCWRGS